MNSLNTGAPIVLAAGGTGGHIFPAEALAEALLARGESVVLMTDKRFANFTSGALSTIPTRTIHAGTAMSGSVFKKLLGGLHLLLGIWQARSILHELKPKVVVGFGGYPSFPTVFAASLIGRPTIIHEQNSVLGRANRLLASRVTRIATSLPETRLPSEQDKQKELRTGNPVRAAVRALREIPYMPPAQDGVLKILVTGGSQGASVFSEVVPAAIALLPANLRNRIRIDQQCRAADLAETKAAYADIGVSADLASFFADIPARLASAHLVIARAGASTVFEVAVAGRPAILVPLPTAMDNHQYYNAHALEQAGGGWVMTQDGFTASSLSARLEAFLSAPDVLSKAAHKARELGEGDAAAKLADMVLAVAEGKR